MVAAWVPALTGALEEGVSAIYGYKALKRDAWLPRIKEELKELSVDEGYIQSAEDNVNFVKQQKEFSNPNSTLMIDWLFKESPALFSTETKTKAVDRTKSAFDSFPGIIFDKATGVYSINFDVDQLNAKDISELTRGTLSTTAETVEEFQLNKRN